MPANFETFSDMPVVRLPAVAGQFYPDDPVELRRTVKGFLAGAEAMTGKVPKAIIAPHAGYEYSGPIAGSAYARLANGHHSIKRVVLLGPSHFVTFPGLAASSTKAFQSPLGSVPVDRAALAQVCALPFVTALDAAHEKEHSLEVHLPFLQIALDAFKFVPLLVGDAAANEVETVLNELWGGAETCLVISSDLSHYHDYQTAQQVDHETAQAIASFNWQELNEYRACGCHAIHGLLRSAKVHDLRCHIVDLRNSGDTSGRRDRVVGYGAFVFVENR